MKDHTWTELTPEQAPCLLAVPIGATEQHGPHLPFTVDTEIAVALCERLARRRPGVLVAPPLPYGSSGEHAGFPGTLSIGQEATETVLVELVRSATADPTANRTADPTAFAGVALVCAHGGNLAPLRRAVARLRGEGRNVCAWCPSGPADDSHAGRTETSVMLALRPSAVRTDRLAGGNTAPLPELIDRLREGGVRAVSPSGVLGDPAGATAEEGWEILLRWEESLLNAVETLDSDGMMSSSETATRITKR